MGQNTDNEPDLMKFISSADISKIIDFTSVFYFSKYVEYNRCNNVLMKFIFNTLKNQYLKNHRRYLMISDTNVFYLSKYVGYNDCDSAFVKIIIDTSKTDISKIIGDMS